MKRVVAAGLVALGIAAAAPGVASAMPIRGFVAEHDAEVYIVRRTGILARHCRRVRCVLPCRRLRLGRQRAQGAPGEIQCLPVRNDRELHLRHRGFLLLGG